MPKFLATGAMLQCTMGAAPSAFTAQGLPGVPQFWLKAAEPIAIACTALNGICAAVGIALGKWVDDQTADDGENNIGATKFVIGDGSFELTTATPRAL